MTWEELVEYHRRRMPRVHAADLLKVKAMDVAAIPVPRRDKLPELFPTEDKILCAYYQEVGEKTRALTPEEEEIAWEQLFHGDEEAAKRLVEHYIPLVVAIAWEYRQGQMDFLDRVEAGNRSLTEALVSLSYTRQKDVRSYIADEIRKGVYHSVWGSLELRFPKDYPLEAELEQVLDQFSREDVQILRELARAEDREQRLLELAVQYDQEPYSIVLTWKTAVRRAEKRKNRKAGAEDS